jgi:hypothetical protein
MFQRVYLLIRTVIPAIALLCPFAAGGNLQAGDVRPSQPNSVAATRVELLPTQPASAPHLAAYRWVAPKGPANVDAYGQWLGYPEIWAEDFDATETWDNIENPGWLLKPWSKWVQARSGRRMLLGIPMLVGGWDRSGPKQGIDAHTKVSLEAGAAGEYDKHYRVLAKNLVAQHLENSVIRLGWEFNGGWYVWRGSNNPKAWAEYFRHIVTAMRSVPGADKLTFCWNPLLGWQQFPAEQAWPGDTYVDVLGIDAYDESWDPDTYPIPKDATAHDIELRQKRTWNSVTYYGSHGLRFWQRFAQAHHKPIGICEWGVNDRPDGHGGGDDPYYVEQMHQFIIDPANDVQFESYFDVRAPDGNHQLSPGLKGDEATEFPRSAAKFRELFGHATGTTK